MRLSISPGPLLTDNTYRSGQLWLKVGWIECKCYQPKTRSKGAPAMPSVTFEKTMPHYAAVGRVASEWAMLEHEIQEAIWDLAGLNQMTGTCITSQIASSGRLMDAVLALLEQKGASARELKPLRSLSEKIAEKQRMRNRILHDPWYFHFDEDGTTTGYRLQTSAAKTAVHKLIKQDHEKLETLIQEIQILYLKFRSLVAPWRDEVPPTWPPRKSL
jgi:hypothetical protein